MIRSSIYRSRLRRVIAATPITLVQVEVKAEIIAARRQTTARSEHCLKNGCCHFRLELYLLSHLSMEARVGLQNNSKWCPFVTVTNVTPSTFVWGLSFRQWWLYNQIREHFFELV